MPAKLQAWYQDNGRWRRATRWEMLDMPETDYYRFLDTHTLYLDRDPESPKLTFNRLQKTFRFYPGEGGHDDPDSAGMTVSHLLAQEVIAGMEVLPLRLRDRRCRKPVCYDLDLRVSNSFCEYPIEKSYIADIRVFFNEPEELALKWGGVANLEIFATSRVRGDKIAFFEERREPLVEIRLSEKLLSSKKVSEISREEEEALRRHLQNAFSKRIFGDLLVSPSSEAYLADRTIRKQRKRIDELEKRLRERRKKTLFNIFKKHGI